MPGLVGGLLLPTLVNLPLLLRVILPLGFLIVAFVDFDHDLLLTGHFDALFTLLGLVRALLLLLLLPLDLLTTDVLQLLAKLVTSLLLLIEVHFHGLLESTLTLVPLMLLT